MFSKISLNSLEDRYQKVPELQFVINSSVFWPGTQCLCSSGIRSSPVSRTSKLWCQKEQQHLASGPGGAGAETILFSPIVSYECLCSTSVSRTLRWRDRLDYLVSLWSSGSVAHRLSTDHDPLELHKPYASKKVPYEEQQFPPRHTPSRCAHQRSHFPSTPSRQHRPQQSIVLISYSPTTGF